METIYSGKTENRIIRRLFLKSEVSWGISDFSKAIGPIIDLFFVSRFIGIDGVTVLGYMSPLIIFEMAKDVKYTSTFGANNLIIRV